MFNKTYIEDIVQSFLYNLYIYKKSQSFALEVIYKEFFDYRDI